MRLKLKNIYRNRLNFRHISILRFTQSKREYVKKSDNYQYAKESLDRRNVLHLKFKEISAGHSRQSLKIRGATLGVKLFFYEPFCHSRLPVNHRESPFTRDKEFERENPC